MQLKKANIGALLSAQKQYAEYFFENLDLDQVQKILNLCLECKGPIFLTGVGKSGIIAEKIATTLVSTGTKALCIPAQNFLHGDIGAVSKGDVVLILSKSGETNELVELVPHIKQRGAKTLTIVSNDESRLARISDISICLPVEKELCPFDLAPTTSTAVQLLFGDLLAVALMQEKGFSIEEYATNHPSGAIGKQITQTVSDLMKTGKSLPICKPTDPIVEVIVELSDKKCGCLLIVNEENELLGIFTDGDLRRALEQHGTKALEKPIEALMNKNPITTTPNVLAHHALKIMQEKRLVTSLAVIDNNKLVGLVRMHDIIHEGI